MNEKTPGFMTYHQECDYCGGYDEGHKDGYLPPAFGAAIRVTWTDCAGNKVDEVRVCPKCFIRVFDAILGERRK